MIVWLMDDSRLIGTWRSDKRKTSTEMASRRNVNSAKYKKLISLFGKLELRYTRSHCYSRFETHKSVSWYKVLGKDDDSVVILSVSPTAGKQIVHIHFEGSRYWVYLGSSGNREFFRRIQ